MKEIRERLDIEARVEDCFDGAQGDSSRKGWDPFVREIEAEKLNGRFPQKGTKVRVVAWHRLEMVCEYLKYDRPYLAMIRMIDGPIFLKKFAGTWRFLYLDHQKTAVIFLYNFEMQEGWKLLERPAQFYFRWEMKRRLRALKKQCEVVYSVNLKPV